MCYVSEINVVYDVLGSWSMFLFSLGNFLLHCNETTHIRLISLKNIGVIYINLSNMWILMHINIRWHCRLLFPMKPLFSSSSFSPSPSISMTWPTRNPTSIPTHTSLEFQRVIFHTMFALSRRACNFQSLFPSRSLSPSLNTLTF